MVELRSLAGWAVSFHLVPGLKISYSSSGFLTLHPFDVNNPSTIIKGIYCWSLLLKVTVLLLLPVFFIRWRRGSLWWSARMPSDKLASGSGPEAVIRVRHSAIISWQWQGRSQGRPRSPASRYGSGQDGWRRAWDRARTSLLPICEVT